MKTEIEIFDVTETRNGVKVDYCLYDADGQANISQTIPADTLETYIVDNDLHSYEYINYNMLNLECDGLDQGYHNPADYLTENSIEVVLGYLQANLTEAA